MKPVTCSDEVFQHLTGLRGPDADGDTDIRALMAFALIEQERVEWAAHMTDQGTPPSEADTRAWYVGKPENFFADRLRRGESFFAGAARLYMQEEMEEDRERAVRAAIGGLRADIATSQTALMTHIDRRAPGAGWGVSILGGVAANVVFAAVLALLFFVAANKLNFGDVIGDIAKGKVEQGR